MWKTRPTVPVADRTLATRLKGLTSALSILMVLLGFFEGDRLNAYRDLGGVLTICRGITHNVRAGQVETVDQCQKMDTAEAIAALAAVNKALLAEEPPTRQAALADFYYNVGAGNFLRSSVLRLINADDIVGGCNALNLWIYVKGRVVAWQVKRRGIEQQLCLIGVS
jgi:lysozyme